MKNVLIITLALFSGMLNAANLQTGIQQKKADYFAVEAIKYFKLDPSKKEAIYQAKLGMLMAQKEMANKRKSGELSEADTDQYRKENVYPFSKELMKIMGVEWKQLDEFNKKVNPEMDKLRP